MPAAAIVLPIAESFGLATLGVTAGGVGTAALTAAGASAIAGNAIIASTVGGAIIGAGTGALNAAIQGGDIIKGATTGALTGGVGQGVGTAVSGEVGKLLGSQPLPAGMQGPQAPAMIAGSAPIGEAVRQGLAGAATGAAQAAVTGKGSDAILRQALLGGVGGATAGGLQYGFGLDPKTAQSVGQLASTATGYATTPSPSYPTYQAPPSPGLSGQGPAPSATLGQSLSIAPTLGYSPGMTVFGSGGEGDRPKQRVWNVASLRNIGEEA